MVTFKTLNKKRDRIKHSSNINSLLMIRNKTFLVYSQTTQQRIYFLFILKAVADPENFGAGG